MVDDRVEGDGGFAGLAVADDEFALAAADGDHAVDCLDAGLEGFLDGLSLGDAGGDDVHLAGFGGWDGRAAVEGDAQGVDDAADDGIADGDFQQAAGALDGITFFDVEVVTEDDGADGIFLKVEDLADGAVLEFEEFTGHGVASGRRFGRFRRRLR